MRSVLVLMAMTATVYAVEGDECTADRKRAAALRNVLASVGETTAEYRSMMVKKIQDAETAAANCERASAEQKRANGIRLAETKREEAAAAKRASADRFAVDELKSQANFIRLAWSAYECSYEKGRDDLLANPFATAEQKEGLAQTELMLGRIRSAMKRGKLSQMSCRAEEVARLAFCISDSSANPACGRNEMTRMILAENEIITAIQLVPSEAPLTPTQAHARSEHDDMVILAPQF